MLTSLHIYSAQSSQMHGMLGTLVPYNQFYINIAHTPLGPRYSRQHIPSSALGCASQTSEFTYSVGRKLNSTNALLSYGLTWYLRCPQLRSRSCRASSLSLCAMFTVCMSALRRGTTCTPLIVLVGYPATVERGGMVVPS